MLTARRVLCWLLVFLGVLFTPALGNTHAFAEARGQLQAVESYVPVTSYNGAPMPDWSQITFNTMPAFQGGGSIRVPANWQDEFGYDPSRTWSAGSPAASVLRLGDFQGVMNFQDWTIGDYMQMGGGLIAENTSLANLGLLNWQTLGDLVNAIPGLENSTVEESPAIADLISFQQFGDVDHRNQILSEMGDIEIGSLVGEDGAFTDAKFSDISLDQYSMKDISGLQDAKVGDFKNWEQAYVNQIPGLADTPMNKLTGSLTGALGFIATFDVPYGDAEHITTPTTRSITGSNKVGFHYQCAQNSGCAYMELASSMNLGPLSDLGLHGAQWIKGGRTPGGQMVPGGYGVLSAVNNGEEATGRHPFGEGFKLVLTDIDEPSGSGTFGLYTRYCQHFPVDLGCTPYFIGPIPLFTVKEKSMVIVGLTEISPSQLGDLPLTPEQQEQVRRLMEANQGSFGDGRGGSFNFNSECVQQAAAAVPANMRSEESDRIVSAVMEKAQEAGVSDPAQIAYILATIETETSFRVRGEEGHGGRHGQYYGRGLVQVTHEYGYRYWSNRLGIDLMSNPEQANNLDTAASIAVYGMRDGVFANISGADNTRLVRTDRGLDHYINGSRTDFAGARSIVNDSDKAQATANKAQQYLNAISGCSNESIAAGGGESNAAIMRAIERNIGMSSRDCPGTNNGRLGCACIVNRILMRAGFEPLGSGREGSYSVPVIHDALQNGRGTEVSASEARAGDIIIIYRSATRRHTGFCLNDGCTRAISNSSSGGAFNWESDGYFSPSYGLNSRRHIYRLNN